MTTNDPQYLEPKASKFGRGNRGIEPKRLIVTLEAGSRKSIDDELLPPWADNTSLGGV